MDMTDKEDDKQEPMTLQEYIIARLEMPVAVKGGGTKNERITTIRILIG